MARANPLMDRKVVEVVFVGAVAMVAGGHLTTTVGCSVVSRSCSCVVVVLWWSGVVAVMCNKCGAVTVAVVVVVVVVVWCNQRIVL